MTSDGVAIEMRRVGLGVRVRGEGRWSHQLDELTGNYPGRATPLIDPALHTQHLWVRPARSRAIHGNIVCIRAGGPYGEDGCLDSQPLSRHGRSVIEFVFIEDLKPDRRGQSGKEQSVYAIQ